MQPQAAVCRVEIGHSIMLHSGAWIDLTSPSTSNFRIEDIAHGLAHLCRYAGQCRDFYSVAEHSIFVCDMVPEHGLSALLHDAAEAFLGDITRPLKQMLPDYRRIEHEVQNAIFSRFNLPLKPDPAIKHADLRVLAAEQRQIMPVGTDEWAASTGIVPAPIIVRHLLPAVAKDEFLSRFATLERQRT